jgi:hypothetical protein
MRRPLLALVVPVVIAVVALALVAARDERGFVDGLAVSPVAVATELMPGQEVCQSPVSVAEAFARVRLQVGTYARLGPALEVTIRDAESRARLARGRLAGGYADGAKPVVFVGQIEGGRRFGVCIKNVGTRSAALIGSAGDPVLGTGITLDGRRRSGELTLSFYEANRSSALEEVPQIIQRASVFRPGVVGSWTFWALFVLMVVGVPLFLLGALRSSLADR